MNETPKDDEKTKPLPEKSEEHGTRGNGVREAGGHAPVGKAQQGPNVAPGDEAVLELHRRGNIEKCPVCGSRVDGEAYHCPTCQNSFCYHCRARLLPADTQLECVNQECGYYGKLICSVCNTSTEKQEPPAVYFEPEEGYWPLYLIVVLAIGAAIWYQYALGWAVAAVFLLYGPGGFLLQRLGVNIFGRERRVEHQRKARYHACIHCQQAAKQLQLNGR